MPHNPPRDTTESPLLCRKIDIPKKRRKNKPNTIDRTQKRRKTAENSGIEAVLSNKNDRQRRKNLKNRPPERPRKDSDGYGPRSQSVANLKQPMLRLEAYCCNIKGPNTYQDEDTHEGRKAA